MLLIKLYNEIYKTKVINIPSAPHWRTLEHYGGHLNILKFRDGFNKIEYEEHGEMKIPIFNSIRKLYEAKIKF